MRLGMNKRRSIIKKWLIKKGRLDFDKARPKFKIGEKTLMRDCKALMYEMKLQPVLQMLHYFGPPKWTGIKLLT